jgi:archaellum component FlaF (FlaF/FlaG flagellin family)
MGFSTSAVVVILTASIIYMAAMFYPLAEMSHRNVIEAEKISNELWKEKLNTKIVITNWSSSNITVYNDGSVALNSSKIDIILDGQFKVPSSYTTNPGGIWPPKTSINVNIGAASGSRVKVIAANGASDYAVS